MKRPLPFTKVLLEDHAFFWGTNRDHPCPSATAREGSGPPCAVRGVLVLTWPIQRSLPVAILLAGRSARKNWIAPGASADRARGAALIWSVKEASVKATGAGFHLFDPLEVRVGFSLCREQGILFEVSAGRPISACARAEGRGWVSVAWTCGRPGSRFSAGNITKGG
jgi:hypothetical protein